MLGGVLILSPSSADGAAIVESLRCAGIPGRHLISLKAARELLERESFGAILTEVLLPDGGWRDVLALIKGIRRDIPVVVAARLANASLWTDVLDLGGYDLIATPYCLQEVQRILANALHEAAESQRPVRMPPGIERRSRQRNTSTAAV